MWPETARCIICNTNRIDLMLVQIIEVGSGPGHGQYACPTPCAQQYATRTYAPDWLRDDLRKRGLWPPSPGDGD
ncbi:hypothetical protein ACWGJ2_15015 [Streptomyces sp. NPDC054796]